MSTLFLDELTRANSAFGSFQALLDAKGEYRPSIDVTDPARLKLADEYDNAQKARGDARRAFRYGNAEIKAERLKKEERPLTISDKIKVAKDDCLKSARAHGRKHGARYFVAENMCYGTLNNGNLVGDKDYASYFTKKGFIRHIASEEGIDIRGLSNSEAKKKVLDAEWKNTYFIEGEVNMARSFHQYVNRYELNDWDDEGWIDAREYWDVDVNKEDLK